MSKILQRPLELWGGQVYLTVGKSIVCHDLWSGAPKWEQHFDGDFLSSGFMVADGKVVANCEDQVLYGLNAYTGQLLWTGEGAGIGSYLKDRYLNGILYFSGGTTKRLHAVDIQTGETVWRLNPAEIEAGASDWKPDLYVIPGKRGQKGKVIALTPMRAYCFTAYR